MQGTKEFKVVAKSSNTNSFGLYQMVLVAKDGEAYKTHASMYNAKEQGETVNQKVVFDTEGNLVSSYFVGHEMTSKIADAPQEVIEQYFN